MIGIGGKLEKRTKIKILAEKARDYNGKYDQLVGQGVDPQAAMKMLDQEQYSRRHENQQEVQPYKIDSQMNQLGGSVHLGYKEAHKTISATKQMFKPMETNMQTMKSGQITNFNLTKTPEEKEEMIKIKARIKKDHLQEDADIRFEEKMESDYKRNFKEDDKMKDIRGKDDKMYNQRKNDLKWYAETYIKTKESLRKC